MKPVLLFDLGDTLVGYYQREEFPPILHAALQGAKRAIQEVGLPTPADNEIARRAAIENHEARNFRVRPLEQRLLRIFGLGTGETDGVLLLAMCRAFLKPIFAVATVYPDTLPALSTYRELGYSVGILSNSPWGAPAALWQEELARHGLGELCDRAIFCTQVGWRKPAQPMFRLALHHFACQPQDCLFVGDQPKWDILGARRAGMFPVLIDRRGRANESFEPCIRSLPELAEILKRWQTAHFTPTHC